MENLTEQQQEFLMKTFNEEKRGEMERKGENGELLAWFSQKYFPWRWKGRTYIPRNYLDGIPPQDSKCLCSR